MRFRTHYLSSISSIIAAIFLVVSIFGISVCTRVVHAAMAENPTAMSGHDMSSACATVATSSCVMSAAEHLDHWQGVFGSIFNPVDSLALGAMFAFVVLFFLATFSIVVDHPHRQRYKNYLRAHPALLLYNFLIELFSRGILQPKLYA